MVSVPVVPRQYPLTKHNILQNNKIIDIHDNIP